MVEFVSYDGSFPCLCSGNLVLKINGKEVTLRHCMASCGSVYFSEKAGDYGVDEGLWMIKNLPDELEQYRKEIEDCVNDNVPHGCCGGCI